MKLKLEKRYNVLHCGMYIYDIIVCRALATNSIQILFKERTHTYIYIYTSSDNKRASDKHSERGEMRDEVEIYVYARYIWIDALMVFLHRNFR